MTPKMIIELMDTLIKDGVSNIQSIESGFDGMYVVATIKNIELVEANINSRINSIQVLSSFEYTHFHGEWFVM